jgi:hypothetical protein
LLVHRGWFQFPRRKILSPFWFILTPVTGIVLPATPSHRAGSVTVPAVPRLFLRIDTEWLAPFVATLPIALRAPNVNLA